MPREQAGVQSIETGMRLLGALADLTFDGPPPMLKDLAAAAKIAPAKAHRYLVSFSRTDLVERDFATGRYRLGPRARRIGISAIRSLDVVRQASAKVPDICAKLKHSAAVAIWTHNGPTIVWVEDVRRPVTVSTRVGEILPILSSATGRVFGAWLPRSVTTDLITREIAANRRSNDGALITKSADADALFAQVRAAGVGWTIGGLNKTISAVSTPIFDFRGVIVAAVALLGPIDEFDADPQGPLAAGLREASDEISTALGYKAGTTA